MKKIIHIALFLLAVNFSFAQQLPQYSQYMLNEMAINPAVAGRDDVPEVHSNNRYQWTGITDAPRTYMLTLQGPIQQKHMGLGMNLYTDIVGPTRRTGLTGSYAYHLQLNDKKMFLSMALSAGVLQWGIDGNKITLHDEGDQKLLTTYQNTIVPDLGAGLYFYQKDKFYFGLSVPQMYQAPIGLYASDSKNSKIVSQINLNGAYTFSIGADFKVEPSFLFKYEKPAPPKIDIGVRAIYRNMVWAGAVYRHHDAISFLIGYMFNNYLMFGYSYDVTTTNIKKYSTGSNEIMLGIRFSRKQSATWEMEKIQKTEEAEKVEEGKKQTTAEETKATEQAPKMEEAKPTPQDSTQVAPKEEGPKSEETPKAEQTGNMEEPKKTDEAQKAEETKPVEETPKPENEESVPEQPK